MSDIENVEPDKKGVSRRTVTKAMAWAVPVIAIATPVPAFAASGNPPGVRVGVARKLPGQSCAGATPFPGEEVNPAFGFVFPFEITNDSDKTIYIINAEASTNPATTPPFNAEAIYPALGTPILPGDTVIIWIYTSGPNSGNFSTTATVSIYWGHSLDDTDHPPITKTWFVPAFPPVVANNCTPLFIAVDPQPV